MTKGRRDHDNSYVKINSKNLKFLLSLIIADNGRLAQRETVRLRIQRSEFDSPPKQMDVSFPPWHLIMRDPDHSNYFSAKSIDQRINSLLELNIKFWYRSTLHICIYIK